VSPRRREKVAFAASFLRAVDRAAAAEPEADAAATPPDREPPPLERPDAPFEAHQASHSLWTLRLVAAIVLAASGTLLFQSLRSPHRADAAPNAVVATRNPSHEADPPREPADARDAAPPRADRTPSGAAAFRDPAHVRESARAEASEGDPSNPAGAPAAADAAMNALVLLPQTRAAGPVATLAIPPSATRARFDLRLESNEYSRYQVSLTDPASNQIVWRSGALTPAAPDDALTVSVMVPARVLKAQHYSLALGGRTGANTTEIVGSYSFRVVRP
jgi:hypothetical protein